MSSNVSCSALQVRMYPSAFLKYLLIHEGITVDWITMLRTAVVMHSSIDLRPTVPTRRSLHLRRDR